MDKENKKMIALGKGQNGGGGNAVWGQITGTLSDQTDLMNQLNLKVGSASDNTFTGNNTFTNDTLIGDLNDIGINLSVVSYGIPVIEGYDNNTSRSFSLSTDGFSMTDANLGDYEGLAITLDGSTGEVAITSNFGNIDLRASSVTVNGQPIGGAIDINDMTQAELLNFYTNYATLMQSNTYVVNGYTFSTLTVTDPQAGTVLVLEYNPQFKDQAAGAAAGTIDVTVGVVYIFADGSKQTTTLTYTVPRTSSLATVATSGSYNDLSNRPNMSTETLTFIDANNVSTTVVVYTQPQI